MPKRREDGKKVIWNDQMDQFLNALVIDEEYKKGSGISWEDIHKRNKEQFTKYGINRPDQLRDRYRTQIHKKRNKSQRSKSPKEQHTQKRRRNLWTPARDIFLYASIGGNV